MTCPICDSAVGRNVEVREMMLGLRHHFTYFECRQCGSLHLVNPPKNMGDYYPRDAYYSYNQRVNANALSPHPSLVIGIRDTISKRRNEAQLFNRGGIGRWLSRVRPNIPANTYKSYVSHCEKQSFDMRILDVGCGDGSLLYSLAQVGFRHLEGIDPYFTEDLSPDSTVRIRPLMLDQVNDEPFDLIILNHSLEHMPNQVESLSLVKKLLSPSGCCRIEVPVADSCAYQKYHENWVELDAPRHYCLHTVRSLALAASKANLRVNEVVDVGTAFEFWGSELYCRDQTLMDTQGKSPVIRDPWTVFTNSEMQKFEEDAIEANTAKRGGRAVFYLSSSTEN